MIKVRQLTKTFDGFRALNGLDLNVRHGSIYGLVGVNGSGKTTLIKHLTGVYRQDSGEVTIDGTPVYDNVGIKKRVGFIPDELYFFQGYNITQQAAFYRNIYPHWNGERFTSLVSLFGLDKKRPLAKFSKGMQKQAAFALVMAASPDVLILDEPIDGLDPLVRKNVLQAIVDDVAERDMTVLVSSHNLKEMEGICDSIGIVNGGRMIIERDLDDLKSDVHKIQVAFAADSHEATATNPFAPLTVLSRETRGSVHMLVVRGRADDINAHICALNPVLYDILPLTLEEIFIYEANGAAPGIILKEGDLQ